MINTLLNDMKKRKVVEYGDFDLSSGKKSKYYVDIKTALTDPCFLYLSSLRVVPLLSNFDVVAGIEVGGIPLAVMASVSTLKPYVIIRKKPTDHGKNSIIIGDVKDKRVILIEDVTTTGLSALQGVHTIRKMGGYIDTVITIIDREEGAEKLLNPYGVQLIPIVKISELIE